MYSNNLIIFLYVQNQVYLKKTCRSKTFKNKHLESLLRNKFSNETV